VIDYMDEQAKNDFAACGARRHLTEETGHGREEIRSYVQMQLLHFPKLSMHVRSC
jgi:hypothetical protein